MRKCKVKTKGPWYGVITDLRPWCRAFHVAWGGGGIQFFSYQLAFGITLRWWEHGPAFRLYVGPFKLWLYFKFNKRKEE